MPDSGSIYIETKKSSVNKNIGYMLQKDHLLEWRTTVDNVTLGLEIQGKLSKERQQVIDKRLNTYGLGFLELLCPKNYQVE